VRVFFFIPSKSPLLRRGFRGGFLNILRKTLIHSKPRIVSESIPLLRIEHPKQGSGK
jgi:hypothetical protein